jgi:hypothetical protein
MYVAIMLGLRLERGLIKAVGERLDHKMGEIHPSKPFKGYTNIQHQWLLQLFLKESTFITNY